jgi:transcriptional regulator with XRE-family HTH domain
MPTIARRPAAQQERERLQARRLRAGELFAIGVRQAEIARQLGVSRQAVSLRGRDEQAPAELDQAAAHCRVAATHFRGAEVPRGAEHA